MAFRVDRVLVGSLAAGTVLTCLLLWGLSSSFEPINLDGLVVGEKKPPLPAQNVVAPEGFVPSVASTAGKQVNTREPDAIPPGVASPVGTQDSARPVLADRVPAPVPLPPELLLSPKEVSELSGEERAKYERMLETYQQIQAQAERLRKERERLENRVENMEDRNKSLSSDLKEVRELLKEAPAVQHPPSTKDGGAS